MTFSTRTTQSVNAEINMVPLIDVMLVLLIVFMVTAPLMTHSVRIQLPNTVAPSQTLPPQSIRLGLDREGKLSWNGQALAEDQLAQRLAESAAQSPQPELHIFADKKTSYEPIARVMAQASRAGLAKLGFESIRTSDKL